MTTAFALPDTPTDTETPVRTLKSNRMNLAQLLDGLGGLFNYE